MYTATTSEEPVDIKIAMPPGEAEDFRSALVDGGVAEMWSALAKVKIEDAEASVAEDRQQILALIEKGPGFHRLNSTVAEKVQEWLVQACEGHLQQRAADGVSRRSLGLARLGAGVGDLLVQVGLPDRAQWALDTALRIREETDTLCTAEGASLLRTLGVKEAQGAAAVADPRLRQERLESALGRLQEARRIRCETGTENTPDGARLESNIGNVKLKLNDAAGAEQAFSEALRIREETATLHTSEGALLEVNLGNVKLARDPEAALQHYETARDIYVEQGTLATPDGARVLYNIGRAYEEGPRDHDSALQAFEEARRILEKTATLQTADGVNVLVNLGAAHKKAGNADAALGAFEDAMRIREALGTASAEDGLQLASEIRALKGPTGSREKRRQGAAPSSLQPPPGDAGDERRRLGRSRRGEDEAGLTPPSLQPLAEGAADERRRPLRSRRGEEEAGPASARGPAAPAEGPRARAVRVAARAR
ncbi:unnamed protein product, partial [Prorocentrum cordatum]